MITKRKALEYLNGKYDMEFKDGILTIRGAISVIDFVLLRKIINDKVKDIRVI